MLVRLAPDPDQIRWYCQSALNSFKTLSLVDAADAAQGDLRSLLEYLDDAEQTLTVPDVRRLKAGADREMGIRDSKVSDLANLEAMPAGRF
jgi:hypothetical protein